MHLGKAYMLLTDGDRAEKAYKRAIELGLRRAKPYFDLGVISERRNLLDEAERYYRQAIEVVPDFGFLLLPPRADLGKAGQRPARRRALRQGAQAVPGPCRRPLPAGTAASRAGEEGAGGQASRGVQETESIETGKLGVLRRANGLRRTGLSCGTPASSTCTAIRRWCWGCPASTTNSPVQELPARPWEGGNQLYDLCPNGQYQTLALLPDCNRQDTRHPDARIRYGEGQKTAALPRPRLRRR